MTILVCAVPLTRLAAVATLSPKGARGFRLLLVMCVAVSVPLQREDGHEAWLRYASIHEAAARKRVAALPAVVVRLDESPVITGAQQEIIRGVRGLLGRTLRPETYFPKESAIVLGTYGEEYAPLDYVETINSEKDQETKGPGTQQRRHRF